MNLAPTTSGQVDPLETTADLFVAAAQPFGVARPRAIEAYRTFYRTGQLSEDWIAAPNRTLGETLVEGSTRKFTLDVPRTKGMQTESVLIPMDRRDGTTTSTLCVSSQVGCAMGCTFCGNRPDGSSTQPLHCRHRRPVVRRNICPLNTTEKHRLYGHGRTHRQPRRRDSCDPNLDRPRRGCHGHVKHFRFNRGKSSGHPTPGRTGGKTWFSAPQSRSEH